LYKQSQSHGLRFTENDLTYDINAENKVTGFCGNYIYPIFMIAQF